MALATTLFVTFYFTCIGSCTFLCLMGDVSRNDILGRVSRFALIWLPKTLEQTTLRVPIIGPSLVNFVRGGYIYIVKSRNPLLQIFYFALVVGGSITYFTLYSHMVPNSVIGETHTWLPYVFLTLTLYSFFLASTRDPGYITEETFSKYDHHTYDGFLYVKNTCKTCNLRKLPRSKHCSLCNKCIAGFDHHCPWINICVGEDNYRFFVLFVSTTMMYLVYGSYVLGGTIYAEVDRLQLFNKHYLNRVTGEKIQPSYQMVFQYFMFNYGFLLILLVLCVVMGCVMIGFVGYHLYLISRGKTTNETAKWGEVSYHFKNKEYCINHAKQKIAELEAEGKKIRKIPQQDLFNPEKAPSFSSRMSTEFPEQYPENPYNFGLFENFHRVFLPWRYQNKVSDVKVDTKKKK